MNRGIRILTYVFPFLIWEFLAQQNLIDKFYFSSPKEILRRFIEMLNDGTLISNSVYTLAEAGFGFLLGTLLGSFIAYVAFKVKVIETFLTPLFNILNSLPRIAFAPLIILFFGFGFSSKVVIVISLVFFVTFFFVLNELKNIKPSIIERFQLLKVNKQSQLKLLLLPALFNGVIKSLHLNMAFSFVGAIVV